MTVLDSRSSAKHNDKKHTSARTKTIANAEDREGLSNVEETTLLKPSLDEVSIDVPDGIEEAQSFLEIFYLREKHHPNKPYLFQAKGDEWLSLSWAEVGQQARKVATALLDMGLKKGDHVGLLSKNCVHWFIADLGILMAGMVSVPFYPTLPAEELKEVINLSKVKALFVGKLEGWDKQKNGVPNKVKIVRFPHYEGNSLVKEGLDWDALISASEEIRSPFIPSPSDLFTILYTSGTTGTPKGVMLNYGCPDAVIKHEMNSPVYGIFQGVAERVISYLPLNHIAERIASEVTSISAGSEVYFSESLERFPANLQAVQPTQFFAVPRIWVKMQQGVLAKLPQKKLDLLLKLPLVGSIIKTKIRKGLGLNEVRSALSGAAPLPISTILWFQKLDIDIQEAYGATETCGGVTYNVKEDIAPGTVGKPVPGVEVNLDEKTSEILIKAPWNMIGYFGDEEKTNEVLANGHYHTGDTGRFDTQGRLVITGRIKDTFKTAKGKFVLPVPIEQEFAKNALVEQVVVCGLGLPQPIAIVCLSEGASKLDKNMIEEELIATMARVNNTRDNHEKLTHLAILKTAWSEDSGFFTPTLKIKRHVVNEAYSAQYEEWITSENPVIWID